METPPSGHDFEVIGDMGKEFECSICMLLLREPVELPCAHVFCKVCLEHWQDNPMEKDAAFLCPSCKKVYQREQVTGNKFLDRFVKTSMQVKCKENKFGCEWEGKIFDYTQHEEKCVYKSINCTLVGCKERMNVMDQAKHQLECIYRSVECKHCLLEVQFINLKNHYGNCAEIQVNCPNDGCSIITPRKEVGNHTQDDCPYQIVNCDYNSVGCKHQLQRRYTFEHHTQRLSDHMNMLLDGFNMTSQELSSVKEKLRQTEEMLQETEKRLQITEEKLAIIDESHHETKIILNQTQEELQNTNQDLLVANERITKVINHDLEIDKLCFQLARNSAAEFSVKHFDVKVGLESLATMDYNEIPEVNLDSPDVWTDLHKMLEEKVKVPYVDRFIQVMDIMETNKIYRSSEKEVFVKVDLRNFTDICPYFTDYDYFKCLKSNRNDIFCSENFLLRKDGGRQPYIHVVFALPGWNNDNVEIVLLDPTKSDPTLLRSNYLNCINKKMIQNDIVLLKAVFE